MIIIIDVMILLKHPYEQLQVVYTVEVYHWTLLGLNTLYGLLQLT